MSHTHFSQAGLGAGAALLLALLATPAFSADDACTQSLTYNPETAYSETEAYEPVAYRVDKPPRNTDAGCDENSLMSDNYSQVGDDSDGEPINLLDALNDTQSL